MKRRRLATGIAARSTLRPAGAIRRPVGEHHDGAPPVPGVTRGREGLPGRRQGCRQVRGTPAEGGLGGQLVDGSQQGRVALFAGDRDELGQVVQHLGAGFRKMAGQVHLSCSSALHAAHAPNPAEAKLRESLRRTMLQLRTADTVRATLQATQAELEEKLKARNEALDADVRDLKTGSEAIEERARSELGMIKPDEVFFQVQPTAVMPKAPPATAPRAKP